MSQSRRRPDSNDLSKRNATDRKPKATRWAEILNAAAEIFYEKGYDVASLQDIADRVGILKGSIYYYIETKQDLLDQLLREVHAGGLANIMRFRTIEGTALENLHAMIEDHVLHICRNLARTTVYLHELGQLTSEERVKITGEHEFRNEFMALIVRGQEEGYFLADLEPKLTAQVVLSSINSVYGWYRPIRGSSPTVMAKHIAHTSVRGLSTEKGIEALGHLPSAPSPRKPKAAARAGSKP